MAQSPHRQPAPPLGTGPLPDDRQVHQSILELRESIPCTIQSDYFDYVLTIWGVNAGFMTQGVVDAARHKIEQEAWNAQLVPGIPMTLRVSLTRYEFGCLHLIAAIRLLQAHRAYVENRWRVPGVPVVQEPGRAPLPTQEEVIRERQIAEQVWLAFDEIAQAYGKQAFTAPSAPMAPRDR